MKHSYAILNLVILLFIAVQASGQVTVWSENFEGETNNSRQSVANNPRQWTTNSNSCVARQRSGNWVIEGRNTGGEVRWTSQIFDISFYNNVSVSIQGMESGNCEGSDYLRFQYRLNNTGGWSTFSSNGTMSGNFTSRTATQSNINANQLQIRVLFRNNNNGEYHRIDNVVVRGSPINCTSGPDEVWRENFESSTPKGSVTSAGNGTMQRTTYPRDNSGGNGMVGTSTDGVGVWTSNNIDISAATNVYVSVDYGAWFDEGTNSMEDADYIEMQYSLNGGSYNAFTTNDRAINDATPRIACVGPLNGNSLSVRVRMRNTANDEHHYIDNIVVSGTSSPDTSPPAFQNPQADMSVNVDAGVCGTVVNYSVPTAIDDQPVFTGTLPGFSNLGVWNGHSYYYSNGSANYNTANQNAVNANGHLLTVGSQAENDWINARVGEIWIGYTDVATEGDFVWVTGEPKDYENWNGGEPNNSGGEDHTVMYSGGSWNDLRGTNSRRYVVEFQPVIVRQTQGLPPGSVFPVGTTTNTFVATDVAGNTASYSFDVTVTDNIAPEISQLRADYYSGRNFDTFRETLTVNELNYDWGSGAPESTLVGSNNFSIRFQGTVKAVNAGTYTFYARSDDGVRVWLKNNLIINDWSDHSPRTRSGTISLNANEVADLRVEYYENGGGAVIQLEWEGPGVARDYVKNTGGGTCNDISLDLSASGSATISVDDVDPGYTDPCGIASRTLSKTDFTCADAGDNIVTLSVTDVNGNTATCDVTVTITGTPDNSLAVVGDAKCQGEDANVTVQASETGVVYSLYKGGIQIGSSVNGTGANIILIAPAANLDLGNNTIEVKAAKGSCELSLSNNATVTVHPTPDPLGVFHE